jgi:TRAP-type C4-dicarboxylate transport system permease large subunit
LPFVVALIAVLLLIVYVPPLSLALPDLLGVR